MNEAKWYLRTQDETFGPETAAQLLEWARRGRIQPGQEVSDDNDLWTRVEDVPFLDMRFSIDLGDGQPRGPFHRAAAEALLASGRLPPTATIVEVRAPFEPADVSAPAAPVAPDGPAASPAVVEKIVEKEVIKEVRVEVPVETVVEKVVEKVVVDETRVKELEELLAEERRHTGELQTRFDEASKSARAREQELRAQLAAAGEQAQAQVAGLQQQVREGAAREEDLKTRVSALEEELRRLPQAASEVADIQAAVFSIMTQEAEELQKMLEEEKREAEAFRARHQTRADRLLERRRMLMKRAGANIEEMTRKALVERPEDPRTVQLRRELEELRRQSERTSRDYEERVRLLTDQLRLRQTEEARLAARMKDVTQLQQEAQQLREQLQVREKDLTAERQKCEELRQQQAISQQAMLSKLAELETPSFGTAQTLATNQSREAKMVKLPRWMRIGR